MTEEKIPFAYVNKFTGKIFYQAQQPNAADEPEVYKPLYLHAHLPALDLDLVEILGRPNFQCSGLAQLLRMGGRVIARKSEEEQAAVIHWMLGHYLSSGSCWRDAANAELAEIRIQAPEGK